MRSRENESLAGLSSPPITDDTMWRMAERMWERGDYGNCLQFLARRLDRIRRLLEPKEWKFFVQEARANQPLIPAIWHSPISRRTNAKPRGYAGDAETLDLLYATSCPSHESGINPALY